MAIEWTRCSLRSPVMSQHPTLWLVHTLWVCWVSCSKNVHAVQLSSSGSRSGPSLTGSSAIMITKRYFWVGNRALAILINPILDRDRTRVLVHRWWREEKCQIHCSGGVRQKVVYWSRGEKAKDETKKADPLFSMSSIVWDDQWCSRAFPLWGFSLWPEN